MSWRVESGGRATTATLPAAFLKLSRVSAMCTTGVPSRCAATRVQGARAGCSVGARAGAEGAAGAARVQREVAERLLRQYSEGAELCTVHVPGGCAPARAGVARTRRHRPRVGPVVRR